MSTIRVMVEVPVLSDLQRRFLRNDCAFPELMEHERVPLIKNGLVRVSSGCMDLTPLGRAVLAHYEGEGGR